MRYTKEQLHRLARRKVLDVAKFEHLGVLMARKACFRAMQAALRAYRQGKDPVASSRVHIQATIEPLTEAMLGAALTGLTRSKKLLTSEAMSFAIDPLDKAIDQLRKKLNLTDKQVEMLRSEFSKYSLSTVGEFGDNLDRKITEAMQRIVEESLHVADGVKELNKAFSAAGITPTNSFQLENTFRTQSQLAYSAAQWQANQTPEAQEILWGYRYTTVGDDRVRLEHQYLEGVTAPKDDPIWHQIWTPNGYACRCQIIELFEPEKTSLPPESVQIGDKTIYPGPDEGFEFNAGEVFKRMEDIVSSALE